MLEITTALASLKTVSDLIGLTLRAKVDSAVTQKAIESQSAIISLQTAMLHLQSEHQSLLNEKVQLERQLAESFTWAEECQKYDLEEIDEGIFVYAPRSGSPAHWLCTRCFQDKKKSILNRTGSDSRGLIFLCFVCQNSIRVQTTPKEYYSKSSSAIIGPSASKSSKAPLCPNCGKTMMNPIPADFRDIEGATWECTSCGFKQ